MQEVGAGDGSTDGLSECMMVGFVEGEADGSADGLKLGDGDGSIVGEHKAGLPSGESVNMGLFGRHS